MKEQIVIITKAPGGAHEARRASLLRPTLAMPPSERDKWVQH